jgi:hypothetical protein
MCASFATNFVGSFSYGLMVPIFLGQIIRNPAVQESQLEEVTPVAEALSDLSESSEVSWCFRWLLVV